MTTTQHTAGPWRVFDAFTDPEIVTDRPTAFETESLVIKSCAERLPVRINSCRCRRSSPVHDVLFYAYLFGSHESPPVIGPRAMDSRIKLKINDVGH